METMKDEFANRYGGLRAEYRACKYWGNDILLTVPDRIPLSGIIRDCAHWVQTQGVTTSPWNARHQQSRQARKFRVHVTIREYPAHLWHRNFFKQAVAPFSELESIPWRSNNGRDKSSLSLTVIAPSPDAVPYHTWILDGYKWMCCLIDITGWEAIEDDDPPSDPDTDRDEGGGSPGSGGGSSGRPDPLWTPSDGYGSDFPFSPISPPTQWWELEFPGYVGRERKVKDEGYTKGCNTATEDLDSRINGHLGIQEQKEGSVGWQQRFAASKAGKVDGGRGGFLIKQLVGTIQTAVVALNIGTVTIMDEEQLAQELFPMLKLIRQIKDEEKGEKTEEKGEKGTEERRGFNTNKEPGLQWVQNGDVNSLGYQKRVINSAAGGLRVEAFKNKDEPNWPYPIHLETKRRS